MSLVMGSCRQIFGPGTDRIATHLVLVVLVPVVELAPSFQID